MAQKCFNYDENVPYENIHCNKNASSDTNMDAPNKLGRL